MDWSEVVSHAGAAVGAALSAHFGRGQWEKRQQAQKKSGRGNRLTPDPLGVVNVSDFQKAQELMARTLEIVQEVQAKQREESSKDLEHRTSLREQIARLIERLEKQNQAIHDVNAEVVSVLRRLIP